MWDITFGANYHYTKRSMGRQHLASFHGHRVLVTYGNHLAASVCIASGDQQALLILAEEGGFSLCPLPCETPFGSFLGRFRAAFLWWAFQILAAFVQ